MQPDVGLAKKHKLDSDPRIQITIGENKTKKTVAPMLQASLQHQLGVEREIRLASYMNEKKKGRKKTFAKSMAKRHEDLGSTSSTNGFSFPIGY